MGGEGHCPPEQEYLDNLVKRCADFVKSNGRYVSFAYGIVDSYTMATKILELGNIRIRLMIQNGLSISVEVLSGNCLLLQATGKDIDQQHINIRGYAPGGWENYIP